MTIKRISAADFRHAGYLQEVNRRFLHPLGLALEVIINAAGETPDDVRLDPDALLAARDVADELELPAGDNAVEAIIKAYVFATQANERLSGIWDARNDPEGIAYAPGTIDPTKALNISGLWKTRMSARVDALGYMVQPIEAGPYVDTDYPR